MENIAFIFVYTNGINQQIQYVHEVRHSSAKRVSTSYKSELYTISRSIIQYLDLSYRNIPPPHIGDQHSLKGCFKSPKTLPIYQSIQTSTTHPLLDFHPGVHSWGSRHRLSFRMASTSLLYSLGSLAPPSATNVDSGIVSPWCSQLKLQT